MSPAPEPLHKDAKTIYEWFLNVYFWFDEENEPSGDAAARKGKCTEAWLRFRRQHPDILKTKDKATVLNAVAGDWQAVKGREPSRDSVNALFGIDIGSADSQKTPAVPVAEAAKVAAPVEAPDESSLGEEVEPKQELPTATSDAFDQDDLEVTRTAFESRYFNGFIEEELDLDVTKWTSEEVRDFILEHARKPGVKDERVRTIAAAAFSSNVDGALLLAGGPNLLVERTVGHCKWESSILKRDANRILAAVNELKEKARATYWERNHRLRDLYASSVVREALEYVTLCTRTSDERSCSITNVDDDVSPLIGNKRQLFKVVSVVMPHDPMTVMHNVIYYHEPKRKVWRALVSVDFCRHGSAPSGHWHLNRAPLGELVPHWGPSNDIFHGDPVKCPIWWMLLPEGMRYHSVPERAPLYSWATT
eukprot:gene4500-6970_t